MILTNSALNFEPSRQYITTLIDELTTSKKCATLKQRSDHKGNSFFPASEHNRACLIVAASWMSKSTLGKFVPKKQKKSEKALHTQGIYIIPSNISSL